ncbi:hypothetical protein [Leptolyngbya sp. BC1307]|uniref:hypothetical protein n=1 Tax=Leptolyngbya sp. BC1307 TaxID=2029589 RepID=UPI000EFD5CBB|nr:hypothetical protein [Leptolyngbya sp. BC1307]
MPRRKKQRSLIIDKAQSRQAALLSISPELDFGNSLTTDAYDQLLEETREALKTYNTQLSAIDQAYNDFKDLEKSLADMCDRMLTGVAAQFGKNSSEYEMAGGTRKSERRRSRRLAADKPAPALV